MINKLKWLTMAFLPIVNVMGNEHPDIQCSFENLSATVQISVYIDQSTQRGDIFIDGLMQQFEYNKLSEESEAGITAETFVDNLNRFSLRVDYVNPSFSNMYPYSATLIGENVPANLRGGCFDSSGVDLDGQSSSFNPAEGDWSRNGAPEDLMSPWPSNESTSGQ